MLVWLSSSQAVADAHVDEAELRAQDRALIRKMDLHLIPFLTSVWILLLFGLAVICLACWMSRNQP